MATFGKKPNDLGDAKFLRHEIVANPNVAGGALKVESLRVFLPANSMVDGAIAKIEALYKAFTADGVATETRHLLCDDGTVQTYAETRAAAGMPNNVVVWQSIGTKGLFILRVGTHLYAYADFTLNNASVAFNTGSADVTSFYDLGEPDFSKDITVALCHTLSAASVGAFIQCLYAKAEII